MLFVAAIVGLIYTIKNKNVQVLQATLQIYKDRSTALEVENKEHLERIAKLESQVEDLKKRPDLSSLTDILRAIEQRDEQGRKQILEKLDSLMEEAKTHSENQIKAYQDCNAVQRRKRTYERKTKE